MKTRNRSRRRGSALSMAVVLSVVLTGLIVAMVSVSTSQSQMTGAMVKMDQAFFAAESGAQRVAWYCKNGNMSSITGTNPVTGTVNGYAYSTSWTAGAANVINVTSVGSLGNVSYTLTESISPPSAQPALATGVDFDLKNIDVTGDVVTAGNFSVGGSGSLTGDLSYGGTASNLNSVTGTVTHSPSSFTTIDMAALQTTLYNAALPANRYATSQTNKTFDFSAIAGSNKVIYVDGSVTNPTFVGSGTLVVTGTVSVDGFGTSSNPVNIVAAGSVTTTNNVNIHGSIYTGGDWYRGKFSMSDGILYVKGVVDKSNNAQSTLTQGTTPWFDPRVPAAGSSTAMAISKFTGPQP